MSRPDGLVPSTSPSIILGLEIDDVAPARSALIIRIGRRSVPSPKYAPEQGEEHRGRQQGAGQRDEDHERAQHQQENQGEDDRDHERHHGEAEGAHLSDVDSLGAAAIGGRGPGANAGPPGPEG